MPAKCCVPGARSTDNDKTTAWVISDPESEPAPMELVLKSKLK